MRACVHPSVRTTALIERRSKGGHPKITSRGFQFLLEDLHTQLWELLLRYLGMIEVRSPRLCRAKI